MYAIRSYYASAKDSRSYFDAEISTLTSLLLSTVNSFAPSVTGPPSTTVTSVTIPSKSAFTPSFASSRILFAFSALACVASLASSAVV